METLPRKQWNLNPHKINYRSCSLIFFQFFPPGFLYQNSKASRWIYWNPELNRDLVPAVAGQNHDYFKTGKEKNKTPQVLQYLFASGHCTLKPWLSCQKTFWFLQRAVIWVHFLWRCVQAAMLPARLQNAPVSITAVQQCRAPGAATAPSIWLSSWADKYWFSLPKP